MIDWRRRVRRFLSGEITRIIVLFHCSRMNHNTHIDTSTFHCTSGIELSLLEQVTNANVIVE